jgi:hypothetical protein
MFKSSKSSKRDRKLNKKMKSLQEIYIEKYEFDFDYKSDPNKYWIQNFSESYDENEQKEMILLEDSKSTEKIAVPATLFSENSAVKEVKEEADIKYPSSTYDKLVTAAIVEEDTTEQEEEEEEVLSEIVDSNLYDVIRTNVVSTKNWLKGRESLSFLTEPSFTNKKKLLKDRPKSDSSPEVVIEDAKVPFLRRTIDIDDVISEPVLLYSYGQGISLKKAKHFFPPSQSSDEFDNSLSWLYLRSVDKSPNSLLEGFRNRFWNLLNGSIPQKTTVLLQSIFDNNVNVTQLLGEGFEENFLLPPSPADAIPKYAVDLDIKRKESTNELRSVRACMCPNDFIGLQNGKMTSSTVQYVSGKVAEKISADLLGDEVVSVTHIVPPDTFLKHMFTVDILSDGDSVRLRNCANRYETCETMKILDFSCVYEHNMTKGDEINIAPNVRYLVCAFQKPDWYGNGVGHAAFIKADLKERLILGFDSLHEDLKDCFTAMEMFIHQYSLRHQLLNYDAASYGDRKNAGDGRGYWKVLNISMKPSIKQMNYTDCTMWSILLVFYHFLDIPHWVYMLPEVDKKSPLEGAVHGWSGVGLNNRDVTLFKNPDGYPTLDAFMDRFRLFVTYLLSHLKGGEDRLGAPSVEEIVSAYRNAAILEEGSGTTTTKASSKKVISTNHFHNV